MAAWDYYPYSEYCELISWKYLWYGGSPAANLANDTSTFNHKFAEGAYNAYRKGGFKVAEEFKTCIIHAFAAHLGQGLVHLGAPTIRQLQAHLSLKLIAAVARAKADEARDASFVLGTRQRVSVETPAEQVTTSLLSSRTRVVGPGGTIPVIDYPDTGGGGEAAPPRPVDEPAEQRMMSGEPPVDGITTKLFDGYTYCSVESALVPWLVAAMQEMDVVCDIEINLGVKIVGKLVGAHPAGAGGNFPAWVAAERAKGNAIIMGEGSGFPDGSVDVKCDSQAAQATDKIYAVATRDVSIAASLCAVDRGAVVHEPSAGWVSPSSKDMAEGQEAGVIASKTTIYLVAGAAVLGVGALAFYAGRKG